MKPADVPAVYEIYCWYVRHSDACLAWVDPIYEDFYYDQLSIAACYPYLVAEHEGQIIGFGYVHEFLHKEAYQYDAELTIYFVQGPHYGLASALYDELERQCRQMGLVRLIGCTTGSNTPSLAFQKGRGFREYGKLENAGFKGGKWHDVVWTEKRIAPCLPDPGLVKQWS